MIHELAQTNITYKKITDKNLETGNVTLTNQDMVDYYSGKMKQLVVCKQDGTELESYYGYGLQKLIESARRRKDYDYLLAKRHFAPTEE